MFALLSKIVLAVVFAVIAYILCGFIGGLLVLLGVPIATYVGQFLEKIAGLVAVIVFLYYAFAGNFSAPSFFKKTP